MLILTISLVYIDLKGVELFETKTYFLASPSKTNVLVDYETSERIEMVRGTELLHIGDLEDFVKVEYNDRTYLIDYKYLKENNSDVILEESLYVRTPVTLRMEEGLSLVKKR